MSSVASRPSAARLTSHVGALSAREIKNQERIQRSAVLHRLSIEATAERAAYRNKIAAEKTRQIIARRQQECSHVRYEASKIAAVTAITRQEKQRASHQEIQRANSAMNVRFFDASPKMVHDDSRQEIQRANSARSGRFAASPRTVKDTEDAYIRQARDAADVRLRWAQLRAIEYHNAAYHKFYSSSSRSFADEIVPGPVDLDFYRPPPVMVPSDEKLCYLY